MLHECTHAVFDLTQTRVNGNDDEAASYVVDALYFRMTGLRRPRWNAEPHATAGAVADALLRQYQAGTRGIPAIDATAWATLKFADRPPSRLRHRPRPESSAACSARPNTRTTASAGFT